MEFCCNIWTGAAQTSLFSDDRVQKRHWILAGEELFSHSNIYLAVGMRSSHSLLYRYEHRKCSEELHLPVPPGLTSKASTHHTDYIVAKHPHFQSIPLVRRPTQIASTCEPLPYETDNIEDVSGVSTIINCSTLESTVTFPTYPYKPLIS